MIQDSKSTITFGHEQQSLHSNLVNEPCANANAPVKGTITTQASFWIGIITKLFVVNLACLIPHHAAVSVNIGPFLLKSALPCQSLWWCNVFIADALDRQHQKTEV